MTKGVPYNFFVSVDDTWLGPVVYSIASGGEPTHGTATILNASTGQFRYTADSAYTGNDTIIYRGTPVIGTSEIGVVSITVI